MLVDENTKQTFLTLVRLGIGVDSSASFETADWETLQALVAEQGLAGVVVDGVEKLEDGLRPPKPVLLQWIGEVLQEETQNTIQQKAAIEMALLFNHNEIRTYVLKGAVIAECYPKPIHRSSADMDCFLLPNNGNFDAWDFGNCLMKNKGFEVRTSFYKNSTFLLPGLMVENHQFLTPFRGNKRLKALERLLQTMLLKDSGEDRFEGTWLYRPPVMVSALFLVEHAYSHFLHEGLTWRHILDWMMFKSRHESEVDWAEFDAYVDEFGFRKFYDAYLRMGFYLMGELNEEDLSGKEKQLLADIWAPLDLHETHHGVKGKLALAGNTWRARWKYSYFTDISWIRALWIQVKGFLFMKHPSLD